MATQVPEGSFFQRKVLFHNCFSHSMVANRRRERIYTISLQALAHILDSVKRQSGNAVPDGSVAQRDQFVERIGDVLLRRNLRKCVREEPEASLIQILNEAILWAQEE